MNTYTATPSGQNFNLYGIFSQGKNLTHTAPALSGASYTVACDGTDSTMVMKTTDSTINKAVLKNTQLDLQGFSFYSTEIGDGKTLILESGGGTIDLGGVSMGENAKFVVDASECGLTIQSDNGALEVATLTIGDGLRVRVYTDDAQTEGTVAIADTLNANLTLVGHEGDKLLSWNLGGAPMTLGSTLPLIYNL